MEPVVVLVADDEEVVRELLAKALAREGFIALTASDAAEALHISRSNAKIDVLVTDVQMGDGRMNGFELAALIMTERPGIPALIMSGSPDSEGMASEKGFRFVSKPCMPSTVIRLLREVLHRMPVQSETKTFRSGSKAS